ncbi:hypothetical protein ISN45_Aa06g022530 [Arabidopsis thaliana x Arabidopsis arenosa]|uniref:Enabled-like protein (DUF1635) n=1 Tax=Arabidopsis thaliana x Arabidopsis arenosa TaxID=1240361 RepID=A0A8T1YZ12_9BRAS|nr:hypothetical protein ISN45_Aa06g022530 [Arabidopsis thaliana x Arabidopsis arenosa]
MDNQSNALLGWPYYSHAKTTEEIRQSLMYTTLELDQTKMFAYEEIRKRDEQLIHLKDIITKTIKERDEALEKCQRLMFDNHSLQQQKHMTPPLSGASSIEDEQVQPQQLGSNKSFPSSDCEESIMSPIDHVMNPPPSQLEEVSGTEIIMDPLFPDKPLPEKGKLLQAVIKAGPLLQTLLLAGPLPQWRHPPPPLKSFEIPPVTVQCPIVNTGCGKFNRKRVFSDGSYSEAKYQKVLLH